MTRVDEKVIILHIYKSSKSVIMTIDMQAREDNILAAAADLIVRHGYDRITMSDIADAVGLNRVLLYAHFKSKDDLLEALIVREMKNYSQLWLEHIEADPKGGTVAGMYRGVLFALKNSPFMAAIVTRDEATFGKYLRRPGNIFEGLQTTHMTGDLLQAMQEAGAVRDGVDIVSMAYIMDVLATSLVSPKEVSNLTPAPSYDDLMETLAEMFDRMLTPEDDSGLAGGKLVIRQLAESSRAYFERLEQVKTQEQETTL